MRFCGMQERFPNRGTAWKVNGRGLSCGPVKRGEGKPAAIKYRKSDIHWEVWNDRRKGAENEKEVT